LNTTRSILAAVLIATLASAAAAAEHGASKPARSGDDGAHEVAGAAGRAGAGVHGTDPVRPDGGSGNLRRRAMRSSLIAKAPTKNPAVPPTAGPVVHPTVPGTAGEVPRNAIGVTAPTSFGTRNLGAVHPMQSSDVGGHVARTGIGGSVGLGHHDNPHPLPNAAAVNRPAGLNGTEMGRSAASPAVLGGPAHIASGIGGASIRPRR
jgi:hypothetical protein